MVKRPRVALADAVAASSAFPPFLSPFELDLSEASWETVDGNVLTSAGYRTDVLLSDGGVYDNMGREPVWGYYRTVLVSDAGGHLGPARIPGRTGETASFVCCTSSTRRSAGCGDARSSAGTPAGELA